MVWMTFPTHAVPLETENVLQPRTDLGTVCLSFVGERLIALTFLKHVTFIFWKRVSFRPIYMSAT